MRFRTRSLSLQLSFTFLLVLLLYSLMTSQPNGATICIDSRRNTFVNKNTADVENKQADDVMTSQPNDATFCIDSSVKTSVNKNTADVANRKADDVMTSVPICTSRERLDYIRRQLDRHYNRPIRRLKLLVNDKKRIAFAEIPKCASTTLDRFMVLMGGSYTARDLQGQELWNVGTQKRYGLRTFDEHSQHTIAADYRKFIVIRHPLDRFVSAFNDKILTPRTRDKEYKQNLLKFLNGTFGNATEFQRFTKAVLRGFSNNHWNPHAYMCHFDKVDYDDVIRMESFRHDLQPMVTGYLGLNWSQVLETSSNIKRKQADVNVSRTVTSRRLSIFEQIPKNEVLQLKDLYSNDFEVLGYDFDVDSLTMSCRIETSDGRICC